MKLTKLTLLLLFSVTLSFGQNIPISQNPKYSSNLNLSADRQAPKYNSSINPKNTSGLNPFYGTGEKEYLFNESADPIGILVSANSDIYLHYDFPDDWIGYFVRAESNFNLFSLEADWTGEYLCSDSKSGYNLFNEDGEWTGNYVNNGRT